VIYILYALKLKLRLRSNPFSKSFFITEIGHRPGCQTQIASRAKRGLTKEPGPQSLFAKFTNKYICFYSLFRVREEWNKGQLFKREKRWTTALKMIQYWIKSWINRDSSLTYSSLIHGLFKIWIDLKINWIWKKKKNLIWKSIELI